MADPSLFPTYRTMPVVPPRRQENLDRFIPNRSAMDFGYAHYMLTEGRKMKENQTEVLSLSKEAYLKTLAEAMGMDRTRILVFKDKPSSPKELIPCNVYDFIDEIKAAHRPRYIPQTPETKLDLPDIIDDDSLNLMDWGSNGILAIALNDTVHLWNDSNKSASELVTVDDGSAPITSLSWKDDGTSIAVGLNNSDVQLWDSSTNRLVRTFRGGHHYRVGSLDWAGHVLTTGGFDGKIVNNDVRVKSHIVGTFRGHREEVCGLKWSTSGRHLASGGKDHLVNIWDISMASKHSCSQPLHKLRSHNDSVRALAWCPFQYNLLASGGGENDGNIKFWETSTGKCLNSVNTDSQVCALLWNKKEHELLSSHSKQNQLTLWRYPSMVKIVELTGHKSRVLFMDQSPDGSRVASAAGDETLQIWNAFGRTKAKKIAAKLNPLPFSHITIRELAVKMEEVKIAKLCIGTLEYKIIELRSLLMVSIPINGDAIDEFIHFIWWLAETMRGWKQHQPLVEVACQRRKEQLSLVIVSETMHDVLQLWSTLTRTHSISANFLDDGGLP